MKRIVNDDRPVRKGKAPPGANAKARSKARRPAAKDGKETRLDRVAFVTSRRLDFFSEKELTAQTGHQKSDWPLVILKELVDNGLDACEEAGIAPEIVVTVNEEGITIADNGPGIPAETIEGFLDFGVRTSSREAYVAPDRGAQGNAMKTILAIPSVLDGSRGQVEIAAAGVRHRIILNVGDLTQDPAPVHTTATAPDVKTGTCITVHWPGSSCSILEGARERFLQIADDYTWLNPHLDLTVDWFGERCHIAPLDPGWNKWTPDKPTCPHWYDLEQLERLIRAYIMHDRQHDSDRTVREFVSEFGGLSGTAKQKAVLADTKLAGIHLSGLVRDGDLAHAVTARILKAMQRHTKPVGPAKLGIIGKVHLMQRFEAAGCERDSFVYAKASDTTNGVPWIIEAAFGWIDSATECRRLVTGVNWSPGIINPFRKLGPGGLSCDTLLADQYVDAYDPVIVVLHMTCPRASYTDRGKSAVVMED